MNCYLGNSNKTQLLSSKSMLHFEGESLSYKDVDENL